jgi:hypothetical protein
LGGGCGLYGVWGGGVGEKRTVENYRYLNLHSVCVYNLV